MRRIFSLIGVLVLPALVAVEPASARAATCTITGTPEDDVLTGTAGPDVICGLGGADVLRGLAGDDVLDGGDGDDLLVGRDGDDELTGGAGHDGLVPGRGDDVVDGGTERDNVSYRDLPGGVVVDLAAGRATGAQAGSDTLVSVLGMTGTNGADTLVGTAERNYAEGLGGADVVRGGGGPDLLVGGGGADTLDFSDLANKVTVSLATGVVDSAGQRGRVSGFENVTGSPYGDVLTGNDGANVLSGGGSADTLEGGVGDDISNGGPGADYLLAGPGNDAVNGGAGVDEVLYPYYHPDIEVDLDAGVINEGNVFADQVTAVEAFVGTSGNDYLHGGLGATVVSFNGRTGYNTIDTTDGFPGDMIWAVDMGPFGHSGCYGDPGDVIEC